LLVLLVLPSAGCSKPAPSATATPTPVPLEIAARAAEAMLSVASLHFSIERDVALVYIDSDGLLAFKRAEGDFELPDRMRAVVRVITAFSPIDIGMIVLGDDQYATDPITGRWGRLPEAWGQFNLMVLFDPQLGLQRVLQDGILDLALAGSEEIENQRHYRLTGRASGERMRAMTLGFIGGSDVELEVWIGAEDHYVRRLSIVEPESDADNPTTWRLEFSKLGQPVEINAPPTADDASTSWHFNNGTVQVAWARW